jgi:hypothetical protein
LQQHVRAIGADGTFDIDPGQLAFDTKRPARRAGISAQGQAFVTNKIGRFGWPPMAGKVSRTCANDPERPSDRDQIGFAGFEIAFGARRFVAAGKAEYASLMLIKDRSSDQV